jgi:hypothetical protein
MKWFSIFCSKNDGVQVRLKQQLNKDAVVSKSSRNSLVQYIGIAAFSKEIYSDILRLIRVAARRKHHENKKENQQLVSPHDNAPSHPSVSVKDILAKNNVKTLKHPPRPYSPDLAPAEFHLFLRLKSALKRRRICDATDIIKNAM